jgi:non-ribosomal peptide synthetase component F
MGGLMNDVKKTVKSLSRQKLALLSERMREKTVQTPQRRIERRPNRFAPCPLSFAQQRLWFIEQLDPGNAVYNIPGGVKLEGELDLGILERVINEIIRRHEVLRTRIEVEAGEPVQVIDEWGPQRLEVEDLTGLPREEREDEARRISRSEIGTGFDLSRGPLLRVRVLKLDEDQHVLLYTMHHIVSDGWSIGVLIREVSTLYEAFSQGRPSPLPELELQYADYAVWQRERLQGEELERQIEYWRRQLTGVPVLDLPTDRPRPAVQSFEGAIEEIMLSAEVVQGLRELSRQGNTTLYMVLLAAFQVLLWRYSGQEKIVVGSPIANRNQAEIEGMIGFFVNTLVLCTDLSGDPSFRELMGRVRDVTLGAYTHQDVPFEKLVEVLHPERDLSRQPLCQVFFNMENNPGSAAKLSGIRMEGFAKYDVLSKFDLTLYLTERDDTARIAIVYNTGIFDQARIVEMLEQFASLLAQIVSAPNKSIDSYSLIVERSGHPLPDPSQSLSEPRYEPITEIILSLANRMPEQHAISDGNRVLTYKELSKRAGELARILVDEGVQPGDVVGVVGPPSFGLITSLISVFLSGGVLLTIDRNLPILRRRLMLSEARAKHLLYVDELDEQDEIIEGLEAEVVLRVNPENGDVPEKISGESTSLPNLSGDNPAYLFFTSGTTGVPKGVLGSHKGLSHFLTWQRETFSVGPQDRCAQLTGLSFDVVLRDIFLPLTSGATLCLPESHDVVDRNQIVPWLSRENITILHVVPSLAQSWLMSQPSEASVVTRAAHRYPGSSLAPRISPGGGSKSIWPNRDDSGQVLLYRSSESAAGDTACRQASSKHSGAGITGERHFMRNRRVGRDRITNPVPLSRVSQCTGRRY